MMHANEDRMAHLDLVGLLSDSTKQRMLAKSNSGQMPLLAVFDGHGGDKCAEACARSLPGHVARVIEELVGATEGDSAVDVDAVVTAALTAAFERMEEEMLDMFVEKKENSGACACCVIMSDEHGKGYLHVANLGDCRAVVGRVSSRGVTTAVKLTWDHRATHPDEAKRIVAAGGEVKDKRALGDLIPSRTLGDFKTKNKCEGAVIAVPDVTKGELIDDDRFLILASDGLWDDLKLDKVIEIAARSRTPDAACKAIATAVIKKYGAKNTKPNDDLTILAAYFTHGVH
jgi:serine/threonine protein phosphatase PrpC